jgi:hypothetical protein
VTGITKGATVRALKRGTSTMGQARISYQKGDELLVTYVRKDGYLKVQHIRSDRFVGRSFLIESEDVEGPLRPLGEVPEGSIAADDPRLDWLWEDAERVANMSGFCTEYDKLLKELNLPGRLRTHTVKMLTGDGIEIVAKVKARSLRQAEERLRKQLHTHEINETSIEGRDTSLMLSGSYEVE